MTPPPSQSRPQPCPDARPQHKPPDWGKTRVATRGTTVRAVSPTTGGITITATGEVMGAIAGRVGRQMTKVATGTTSVWVAGVTAKGVHRGTAVVMILGTMAQIADSTNDQATVQTASQTIRQVLPEVGVSVRRWPPNTLGRKEIGRRAA